MNLLEETLETLNIHNINSSNIQWCGSTSFGWFTWDEFIELANFDYDDGYGSAKIAQDLLVVGDDWWLERGEYDGSEWWEYKTFPEKPEAQIKPKSLGDNEIMWDSLKEINERND